MFGSKLKEQVEDRLKFYETGSKKETFRKNKQKKIKDAFGAGRSSSRRGIYTLMARGGGGNYLKMENLK